MSDQRSLPPTDQQATWFGRWHLTILMVFASISPFLILGAIKSLASNKNDVEDWLPATFQETDELNWYKQHFVGDQFVVISWEGCMIDGTAKDVRSLSADPRIEKLARLLVSDERSESSWLQGQPYRKYISAVMTGPQALQKLTESSANIPFDLAKQRLTRSLIGADGKQTCVVATLSDAGLEKVREVLARPTADFFGFDTRPGLLFEALQKCELDEHSVHIGGPPVDNVAIDEEGERSFKRLAGISGVLGLLLAWLALGNWHQTLIVFSCGLFSAGASLTTIWLVGVNADAIVLSMPPLVYVLAISGAIHLINYYMEVIDEIGPQRAPGQAVLLGWKPAMYCSVTTAIGLVSLCTSEISPIRKFGLYSAVGVLEMLIVLFLLLPSALYAWPQLPNAARKRKKAVASHDRDAGDNARAEHRLKATWRRVGSLMIRRHTSITVGFVALLLVFAAGLQHFRTSIDLMKLFDSRARILTDYHWLEEHLGNLVPIEIVLSFKPEARLVFGEATAKDGQANQRLSLLDRLKIVSDVQSQIEAEYGEAGQGIISPTMSALTFLIPLRTGDRSLSAVIQRRVMSRKVEEAYQSLASTGYLGTDKTDGSELWRISVRVAAFKDVDYGKLTESITELVSPYVDGVSARIKGLDKRLEPLVSDSDDKPVQAVYTGVIPIVYKAQTTLLNSLISSTLWSFVTITPLLMIVCRGVFAGAVAMIPNVLPVLAVFGGLSWLGMPVDIGSMMAASIALGVAVDDTIHFLTWFRASFDEQGDRHTAILSAYQHCATPTLQATLVNGLGLSVFALSTFVPTRQLGILMLVILIAGAVAELLLLPAILAGPLGGFFKRGKVDATEASFPKDELKTD